MNKVTFEDAKVKIDQALNLTKEALEISNYLFKTDQKNNIVMLWETFVKEFIDYAEQKSKETGVNLLGNISIRKILFR